MFPEIEPGLGVRKPGFCPFLGISSPVYVSKPSYHEWPGHCNVTVPSQLEWSYNVSLR